VLTTHSKLDGRPCAPNIIWELCLARQGHAKKEKVVDLVRRRTLKEQVLPSEPLRWGGWMEEQVGVGRR